MPFDTEESLDAFITAFEAGTWPIANWKHAHHLAMATCYVMKYGRDDALNRARLRIREYNEAQGGRNTEDSGYHETLTVFWIDKVAETIPPNVPRVAAIGHVLAALADPRDLWRDYYTFDVIKSREARAFYIAPA